MPWPLVQPPAIRAPNMMMIPPRNAATRRLPVEPPNRAAQVLGTVSRRKLRLVNNAQQAAEECPNEEKHVVIPLERELGPIGISSNGFAAHNRDGAEARGRGDRGGDAQRRVDDGKDQPTQDAQTGTNGIRIPVATRPDLAGAHTLFSFVHKLAFESGCLEPTGGNKLHRNSTPPKIVGDDEEEESKSREGAREAIPLRVPTRKLCSGTPAAYFPLRS